MKIAIKANPNRGKEIISLLENLGGINDLNLDGRGVTAIYYIGDNNIMRYGDAPKNYKVYTLEEFETQFPFKVGDKVTIIGLPDYPKVITKMTWMDNEIFYTFGDNTWYNTGALRKLEMKEKRNVTLTLDKAKEWYKKGGDLKQVALQAFTEEELTKIDLPKTWKEFCQNYPVQVGECWIGSCDGIHEKSWDKERIYKNWIPSRKSAEAHLAMIQLEQLRNCWRQGNIPQEAKYKIRKVRNKHIVVYGVEDAFLSFCDIQTAEEFLKCFKDLIEQAGDLI